ncbi:MAG: AAA family ATPase [Actinomycetia bacterium]|nr:AAA family ATPase [Actinomycetes bacterium]
MPDILSLRLFGPLHLQTEGGPAQISRLQVRQAMVLLALEPGRIWTLDELIEEMWPQNLPASPRRAIQVVISRLRHALESHHDVLQSGSGECSINPDLVDVDVVRFDDLVAKAVPSKNSAEKIALTQAALELWRGVPFADCPSSPLLDQAGRRLEETRRVATDLLVKALVDAGDPGRAVVVARPAFDADPSQERLALSLARSLAAEGRRAEALEVLGRTRSHLRRESGLDPSPALDQLEQQILTTAVDLSRSSPPSDLTDPSLFVGRDDDLERILTAAGRAGPLTVVGDAGLGKSSLLTRARRQLEAEGRPIVWVTVDPEPARPADTAAAIVTILLDQDHGPREDPTATAISRVLPERNPHLQVGSEIAREGIVEELARFIADSASATDAVLFIDDLHLLDNMSAEVLVMVAQSETCSLLAASRPSTDPKLAPFLAEPTAHELTPLGAEAVQDYLDERYDGRRTPWDSAELHDRCGGNPLFLGLLVDLHLDGAVDEASLPRSLLVAVRERLDSLSDRTIETLQVAAALGTQFSLTALRALRPTADIDLAEAAEARLVAVDETDQGRFIHGLVAEAAYQLMSQGRRVEVHDRLAQILLDLGAAPIDYASHATQAAALDPYRAANANLAAGRAFATAHVLDIAAERLGLGIQILDNQGLGATPLAAELAADLGQVQRLAADPAHVTTLEGAARLAQEIQAPELLARAVIELCSHGGTTLGGQVDHSILGLIDAALDSSASVAAKAELMASVPTLTALSSHYRRGQRLYREAVDLAARSGDPDLEARVLVRAHLGLSHPEDFGRRIEVTNRLEQVAGTDVDLGWEVAYLRFNSGLLGADAELMASNFAIMEGLTPRARHRHLGLAHLRTTYAHAQGNLEEAESLLDEATNLAMTMFPASWALAHYSGIIFAIRDCQGRLGELFEVVESFLEDLPDLSNWRAGLALVAAQTGDLDIALREFDAFALNDFANLTEDLTWSAAVTSLGRTAAILGDDVASERLYEILLPHQGRMSWAGTCTFGPNDYALGVLARTMGHHQQAARHFSANDTLCRRLTNEHYLAENRLQFDFPQS